VLHLAPYSAALFLSLFNAPYLPTNNPHVAAVYQQGIVMAANKATLAAIDAMMAKLTASFTDEIKTLREEVSSLRAELASSAAAAAAAAPMPRCPSCILLQSAPPADQDNASSDAAANDTKQTWTDVVKTSVKAAVKTVLHDEKSKSEVVINKMPENKQDQRDIENLCTKMQFSARPTSIIRLGKDSSKPPRPMKVTFPTPFDARAFLAKADAVKKEGDDELKKLHCRPCHTSEEQTRFLKLKTNVTKLNEESVATESYSLRNNGEVWKYAQDEAGR
jgi:hypothetical protein